MQMEEFFRPIRYVTLKLTNGCNLSCSYCNVEALTPKTPKMSMQLFKRVADLLITNSQSRFVGLEFHGGEPLLLEDAWFEEATAYARGLAHKHRKIIEFPLVTNGTMLTEARLQKLHRLGIRFCMSCDGPPEINDVFRQAGNAVLRAIKLFQQQKIYTGIITVMSQSNYNRMRDVMDWYLSEDVHDFRINFLQPQGRGVEEQLLTGDQMFEGMQQVFEHLHDTEVAVHENEVATTVERFVEGRDAKPQLSCWEYQCQAGRTYVAIDLLGRIHACGTDLANHVLGHVNQPFDEQTYRDRLRVLHHKGDWVIRCFDCNAAKICNHSCPTSDYNSEIFKEHSCRYTKLFWNYLCENVDKAYRVYETLQRNKAPKPASFVPADNLAFSFVGSP